MSTVSERARRAQEAEFEDHKGHDALKEPTLALYSEVDGLTPALRSLVVEVALRRIIPGVAELVTTEGAGARAAIAQGLSLYAGIAGYANALNREADGDFSTGDSRVDDVFDLCRDLFRAQIATQIPPEIQAAVEDLLAKAQARVDAGEDMETAFDEEYAKVKDSLGDYVVEKDGETSKSKPEDDDRPAPGLYL